MQVSNSPILTPENCAKIVANLDECIALFEKKTDLLSGAEMRGKSLLTAVRNEIIREQKPRDGSGSV